MIAIPTENPPTMQAVATRPYPSSAGVFLRNKTSNDINKALSP
jgi:hypothetical protein